MELIELHFYGFVTGSVLDLLVGDPHWFKAHPVRLMGALYNALEGAFLGPEEDKGHKAASGGKLDVHKYAQGVFTLAFIVLLSILVPAGILFLCRRVSDWLFIAAEAFMTCTCLSAASLVRETSPVRKALEKGDTGRARKYLSYVVGRDTQKLSVTEITKAVIETLAENLSDGIISPLFYLALAGPCAGMAFKAVSTGDSMIGYRSERYYSFGRAAAVADDFLNFIPARISAALLIFSSFFQKKMSARGALSSYRADHRKTESPNAGCPESAMAGALGIELGGDAFYGGKLVERPLLGSPEKKAEISDIGRAQRTVVLSSVFMEIICAFVLYLV